MLRYSEITQDLFTMDESYYLAHCISADFAMGAGIAVAFNERFHMRSTLKSKYPDYLSFYNCSIPTKGDCLQVGRVFNLITKERYFHKPTLASLEASLVKLQELIREQGITKLAIPTIGAGLDRLQWADVSASLQRIFKDDDLEIVVCRLA